MMFFSAGTPAFRPGRIAYLPPLVVCGILVLEQPAPEHGPPEMGKPLARKRRVGERVEHLDN